MPGNQTSSQISVAGEKSKVVPDQTTITATVQTKGIMLRTSKGK
jgi:hypothetical protein